MERNIIQKSLFCVAFFKFSHKKGSFIIKNKLKKRFLIVLVVVSVFTCFICMLQNYKSILRENGYENLYRNKEYETDKIVRVYSAEDGQIVQIIKTQGFHDGMEIAVIIGEEEITKVLILKHDETQKYGGYVTQLWFLQRFNLPINKKLELVKLTKEKENEVIAITGATLTSEAVVQSVNECINNYRRMSDEK